MRETIDISRIKQQEDICAEIFETVTADGKRPLAMVDTYGCQQNEADSEKLRGYARRDGLRLHAGRISRPTSSSSTPAPCASTPRCAFSATSAR